MARKPSLTPKQRRFVEEFLLDLNASAAAGRAAYKSPHKQGPRLTSNPAVAAAIAAAQAQRSERTQVTADEVLSRLAAIARVDPRDLVTWGPEGVTLRESGTLESGPASAVLEVSESKSGVRLKRESRLSALELIGKHLGMWRERHEVEATVTDLTRDIESMTDGELEAELERMRGQTQP